MTKRDESVIKVGERYRVLLVEDDTVDQLAFKRAVKEQGSPYAYDVAGSVAEARDLLSRNRYNAVITDYSLGDGTAFDVIELARGIPLVFTTGAGDEEVAVRAMKSGAADYLVKDHERTYLKKLPVTVENAIRRHKAEEQVRKLTRAVEQSPATVVITDTEGHIEYVNPKFTSLTGYTSEEIIGKNPRVLKSGEQPREFYEQLWTTILAGGEWRGEFHNRKKNGDLYWEQALIAPIRDNSNAITHFIAIKEDITERKQLETHLRHAQKMDAIGQLAGGIAHDFNNILTAIVGYASIMELKLPTDSPLKKNAAQIVVTAERGASLTQGLLAFSRKQVSNPVVIDLNEIITRVHQLLLRLISEDIHLEINLDHHVLPVLADSGQIEQVLMNMSTNARDALPHGGSIVITTEAVTLDTDFVIARGFGTPGRYALLTISDSGAGMEAEIVKHVFEPFYTTKEQGKGTGLGLSIVYGIIKEHNGYVLCYSTIGIGTIFQIYLPLLDASPAETEEKIQERQQDVQEQNYILLAEDNEMSRAFGREILEEFGYSVVEAVDGEDALEKFRKLGGQISLVILDVIMPKMNGREVYDTIRGIAPNVRVLFCSGYARDVVISQGGLEEGMDYLAKPFTPKELLMKIREVLDYGL